MYCKFCNTKVEDQNKYGAYCPTCVKWINSDDISETKLEIKTYEVRVPFSGYSRGDKIYHVEATSEEAAEQKVKNHKGIFVFENIVRDDRDEDRSSIQCYGIVEK